MDEDTGLSYFNARWYDAETGRFITEDPARDGANWYIYVANNPLRYIDPTGMRRVDGDDPDDERKKDQEEKREEQERQDAQERMNQALINNGAQEQLLSDLIDIDELAEILANPDNRNLFDNVTRDWMNGFGSQSDLRDAILDQLQDTTVLTLDNSSANLMNSILQSEQTGLNIGSNSMMGIGNTIYNNTGQLTPQNITMNDAALLGHEAIHGIQAVAHGGLSNFLDAYAGSDANNYPRGLLERTAYEFGGSRRHDPTPSSIQILKDRQKYGEWWK